ncbi:MAG: NUDIX domain-containing protein [Acidobacteriota bacterium]|nr:NUDIX domain-containing protein [Acidobacteriota bacterium]
MTDPAPARPAATVVLLRDRPGAPERTPPDILMVRRTRGTSFFGGAFVFPGGRVDEADRATDADEWCDGADMARTHFADLVNRPDVGVSYHVAAMRELFEEAGVLLARDRTGQFIVTTDPATRVRFDEHRHALHSGGRSLRSIVDAEGLRLALHALRPLSHWVTPVIEPKRFDTRFFVACMPDGQVPLHDSLETTESRWMTAAGALDLCRRDEIVLAPPTWRTLQDLSRFDSIAAILDWLPRQPIVRMQPMPYDIDGRKMLLLPGDPLNPEPYPGDSPPETRFVLDEGRWRAIVP